MKDIQVTLYDLFGYLGPGSVALMGAYLVIWRFALAESQDWTGFSSGGWAALAVAAYLVGHVVQALANFATRLFRFDPESSVIESQKFMPAEVVAVARGHACHVMGLPKDTALSASALYDIADHYVQQHGKVETREIYVYREGFYRGLTVAFIILTIGALLRLTGGAGTVSAFGITVEVTPAAMTVLALVSAAAGALVYNRFRRFSVYRVKNSVISFITIVKQTTGGCDG